MLFKGKSICCMCIYLRSLQLEKYDQVISDCRRAIELDPNIGLSNYNLYNRK